MEKLSRNAQVLQFFLQHAHRGLGHTKLQKLAYLADLEARKVLGHPVSAFEYVFHDHGPFDSDLYDAVEELRAAQFATESSINHGDGYIERCVRKTDTAPVFQFSPAEAEILTYVARKYMGRRLRSLLDDVVYETEPMKKVEHRGQRVPVEIVDGQVRDRVGFDLEEVLAVEKRARAGARRPARAVFDGLRARIRERG